MRCLQKENIAAEITFARIVFTFIESDIFVTLQY